MSSRTFNNAEQGSSVRAKLNAIARSTQLFAFDAANQADSLAHQTGYAVGDVVQVMFWDSARRDGGTAVWRAWQTGSGTIGAITNGGASQGIQMQGNGIRWLIVPADGNRVDIRSCGVICDGTTTGQESRVETLRAAAQARGLTLTGAGVLRITRTLDLRFCEVDFSQLLIQAGTLVDSTTAQTFGDFYTAQGTNIQISSITRANPGVVATVANHGLAEGALIEFGVSGLGSLPHEIDPLEPYFVRNPTANTFQVATSVGGTPIDMTQTSIELDLSGTAFVFIPPADNSNFETEDIQLWNGRIARKAYAVLAAGDGAVNESTRQDIRVRGDGNFDYTTESTCIGIKGEGDDSALGVYRFQSAYCFVGATLTGAFEKKKIEVAGTYLNIGVWMPFGTSADTIRLELSLTKFRAAYWEHAGISSSINVVAAWESRDDPGDDSPYVWVRSGKSGSLSGVARAINGLEGVIIDKPKQFGTDQFTFNDFRTIDTYGRCVWIRRARRVAGSIVIYDAKRGPGASGTDTRPAYSIDRVIEAGLMNVAMHHITTAEGMQVGDGTLYSRDANLGTYAIQMGNLQPVQDSNIDNVSGFPSGLVALRARSVKGGNLTLASCLGDIVVDAGVIAEAGRPHRIEIPRHQLRYTRTIDPAAAVEIGFGALVQANGQLPSAIIPQNVVAGTGATATYNPVSGLTTVSFSGEFGSSAAGWSEAVLAADFSTTSTTQTNVTDFSFTPVANKRYIVEGWIAHTANATGTGVRVGVTMPTGLTVAAVQINAMNGAASLQANNNLAASGNTSSTSANSGGAVATMTRLDCVVFAGASPGGAVQITVASEIAANQVTILAGSVLRWRDIG
jgi:hypothetical protein